MYKIKTVSDLSGYPPELLRAWERRYGLLEPRRTESGHRLYTAEDLAVLAEVRRQLASGRSIGEVAAGGRERLLQGGSPGPLAALRERALACALELDGAGVERALDEAFALVSADQVIEELVVPSAHQIGEMWAEGAATVSAEHLQSAVYGRRLAGMLQVALRHARGPLHLVSCLPGERHELAAQLVAYYLARGGLACLYLGPDLPLADLERVCRERRPRAALLSVTQETQLLSQLEALEGLPARLSAPLVLGGAAVQEHRTRLKRAGVWCWPAGVTLRELADWLRVLPL